MCLSLALFPIEMASSLPPVSVDRVCLTFKITSHTLSGMARIFLCAPALATYMMTDRWDPAMPEAFLITTERIQKLRQGLAEGRLNVLVPTG